MRTSSIASRFQCVCSILPRFPLGILQILPAVILATAAIFSFGLFAANAWAQPMGMVELADDELAAITGGDLELDLLYQGGTWSVVESNRAHAFSIGIGEGAFTSAQGITTTLQAVNSAIDLDVIVNIYINRGDFF